MSEPLNRRRFLSLAGFTSAGLVFGGYSIVRGIRFPTLGWEPSTVSDHIVIKDVSVKLDQCIHTSGPKTADSSLHNSTLHLRAYAPEPSIVLHSPTNSRLQVSLNNIATDAQLIKPSDAQINEQLTGITRHLTVDLTRGKPLRLNWKLPALKGYEFASIGDTGGNHELAWCIHRASELGARFLLHLGDFNYQPGDYQRAIELFNNSPIPCYVSIGNHDFHEDGRVYQQFLQEIGPLNSAFAIGATRFANIDTAANFLPYSAGHRGRLINALSQSKDNYNDTVGFTHRPLHTPPEDVSHDIGSKAERDWLISALSNANMSTLLSGHIHIYNQTNLQGINNIIVGQGLGHQDLIVNHDYSKMIIGQVNDDGKVDYTAKPLAMPMELHCHPRIDVVKQSLVDAPHYDVIQKIDDSCLKSVKLKT